MPKETRTYDSSRVDFGDVESIVEHEMRQNSPFNVEVTGRDSATSTTVKASAHIANIMQVGDEIEVVVDAPSNIRSPIFQALESQTQARNEYEDAEFTDVTTRSSGSYTVLETADEGGLIVSDDIVGEVGERDNIMRIYSDNLTLSDARDEFAQEMGTRASGDDIIRDSDDAREKWSGMKPVGEARPTEMLPNDAEVQATMRLYENGMLVMERDGEKEMYETAAGFFLLAGTPNSGGRSNRLTVGEAYTIDGFGREYTSEDIELALRSIESILEDM